MTDIKKSEPKRDRYGEVICEFVVRIPKWMDEAARKKAFTERTSKAEIVRQALARYLA